MTRTLCNRCKRPVHARSLRPGSVLCPTCRSTRRAPGTVDVVVLRPNWRSDARPEVPPYQAPTPEELEQLRRQEAGRVERVVADRQGPTVTDSDLRWGTWRVRKEIPRFPYGRTGRGRRVPAPRKAGRYVPSKRQRQLAAARRLLCSVMPALSERQRAVAALLGQGMKQADVARQLRMSRKNVHKLVGKIRRQVSRAESATGAPSK